jgi:glycosyltransferase involved in cell wall biosynthesis
MRIAIYTRSFPPASGGVSTAHFQLYNLLRKSYEVKMFVYDEAKDSHEAHVVKRGTITWVNKILLRLIKFKYRKTKSNLELDNVSKIISTFIPVYRLNKYLKVFNPDIIIVPDNYVPAYMIKVPVKSKLIWFAHHNYSRFMNQPLLERQDWLDLQIAASMEVKALKKVDAVISPSQYMIDCFQHSTYAGKEVFRIPNFIEPGTLGSITKPPSEKDQFPKGKKVVYIPSAGSDIKGKRYVYEIIRRLQGVDEQVFFYLSGPIPNDLALELKSFGNSIYAPGHVDWATNMLNVSRCYMGITPNIEENFSYAILEGQSLGIPFVAFDTGGNKEIIINNETGYIVDFLDMEGLISKSKLLLQNPDERLSFNKTAGQACLERFSSSIILERYNEVFSSITRNGAN